MEKALLYDSTGAPIQRGLDLDPEFFIPPRQRNAMNASTLTKPYAQHSWVHACVNAIARNISQLDIVFAPASNPEKVVRDHEYINLMKKPNPYMEGSDLIEFTLLSLLLPTTQGPGGQCFWILEKKNGNGVNQKRGEVPFEIYPFSDECIYPRLNSDKALIGWELRLPNGEKIPYDCEEVIRFKLLNPYDLTKGLSPLVAGKVAIEADVKSDVLNSRFFDNNASLGGVLTTEKILGEPQIKSLRENWNEQYGGIGKSGSTAILHSGLKYEAMARTHLEMQFIDQKQWNVDVVRALFGVPKFAIGLYEDLNFATAEAAKRFFWEETILPHCRRLWATLNSTTIKWLDGGNKWIGTFDYSSVEALQDKYRDKIQSWVQLVDRGTPMDRAAKLVRLPLDTKNADYMTMPFIKGSVTNLETGEVLGTPISPEDPNATDKKPPAKKPKKDVVSDDAAKAPDKTFETLNAWVKEIEDEQKEADAFWFDYLARVLDPGEKEMEPVVRKYFFEQRNIIQDNIDAWSKSKKSITKSDEAPTPDDFLPNKKQEDEKFAKKITPLLRKQQERELEKLKQEIGELLNFDIESPSAQKIIYDRLKMLRKINNTTFKRVGNVITDVVGESVKQSWTVEKTAKELKKAVGKSYEFRAGQAKTIARTETGAVSSKTRFLVFESEEIPFHKWVSARDKKVRHEHARGTGDDGEIVAVGETFPHTSLKFPHDPSGEAKQVINCRCITRAVKNKDGK